VIVRVLGSAAGGGVPQWNCACTNCTAARESWAPQRTESCIAISTNGDRWLLVNCSSDIGRQIEAFAPLQPRRLRDTPIAGMLFTDANVDHVGGLATLRQDGDHKFVIRSSRVVREIVSRQEAFRRFSRPPHHWVDVGPDAACPSIEQDDVVGNAITVRAFAVPGRTPGYDGRRDLKGAVLAYELRDPEADGTLLVAPVFSAMNDALRASLSTASIAFLDGTFYDDMELQSRGLMHKTARQLGHQPVRETLAQISATRARVIFTHLNNSNPLLDQDTPEYAELRSAKAEIAFDGMELVVR
jgi:pyrroloquinoline quinone biosynthesis protein B